MVPNDGVGLRRSKILGVMGAGVVGVVGAAGETFFFSGIIWCITSSALFCGDVSATDADEFVAKIGAVDADVFNEFGTQISVDADACDESVGGSILSSYPYPTVASVTMTISKS